MENALIKIALLTVPKKCAPPVEMVSELTLMETVNSQIQTVLPSTTEDVKSAVKTGTQAPEEIALDFQPIANSVMLSRKDLVLSALTDFLSNQTVLVLQSLEQLPCQIVQLSKEPHVKPAIQVSLSEMVDAARFQDFAADLILQLEHVSDVKQDSLGLMAHALT